MVADGDPVTRADIEELRRRIATLEASVHAPPTRIVRCRACSQMVPDGRFCSSCGVPLVIATTGPATVMPPPPAPAPPRAPAPSPRPSPPPVAPRPPPAPAKAPLSLETMLGQRWAPRLGAGLVFLGVIFFLGVAIQRGWIGPLAQLAIAAIAGVALITGGAVLTARRGYGTYPQVLEATGACVLYVTAFVAHAVPYFSRETGLTEIGGGVLMALVSLGTVGLALLRDSRVIVGLGYGLAFLTALLGVGALPAITLAYVAILGTSLAWLVAPKGWRVEGALGTLATGGLLLFLSLRGRELGDPDPAIVALVSLVPAIAFLWLSLRADARHSDTDGLAAIIGAATFAWASVVSLGITDTDGARGVLLLAWALVATLHLVLGVRLGAPKLARVASGIAAVAFWLVGAPFAWADATEPELLTTLTYAIGATALAIASRRFGRGVAIGALVLGIAAAWWAVGVQGLVRSPWLLGDAFGPWQAWITLVAVLAPLAILASTRETDAKVRMGAFWTTAAFGTIWTFALFGTPILTTMWLLVLAAALVGFAMAAGARSAGVATSALAAAFAVLALAALKGATIDTYAPELRLDAGPAAFQATVVAAALLALYHVARARALVPEASMRLATFALVGGSAVVLVNYLVAYMEGAWPSILIGAVGVGYLVAGFVLRKELAYRYAGFATLGFVIVRVFTVDMQNTDLALRAIVFAVLGAILLGIGYVYARLSRKDASS